MADLPPAPAPEEPAPVGTRLALGVAYRGGAYCGWQRQAHHASVQQVLEEALAQFAGQPVSTHCAGRTDAGVHACNQVVHLDAPVPREAFSWVRGPNRYLPRDVAVQWCRPVSAQFHARYDARARRYAYVLRESPVRPALDAGLVGWTFTPLDPHRMEEAARVLIGTHDFSAFRSSECQARSPVKTLYRLDIRRRGAYWRFDFEASAFLHHMVRNLMGALLAVGSARLTVSALQALLSARDRRQGPPTFAAEGLYFLGPRYDAVCGLPETTAAHDWLPCP